MNAFDKIAQKKEPGATKKSSKIAATVTDEIKKAVDIVLWAKAEIKSLEAQLAENETVIIDHIRPQQDKSAYAGAFSKSFLVEGNKGNVTYTTADKFSIPQDEASQEALKKLLNKKYDEFFQTKRTIILLSKVQENEDLINKIIAAVEKAGIDLSEAFKVEDVVIKKEGVELDRKQYELSETKLETFRTMVRQAKASLK